jgi:hypothetical protein
MMHKITRVDQIIIRVCIFFWLTIFLLPLSGCKNKPVFPEELLSSLGIPESEINTRLRLTAPDSLNTHKPEDTITLTVEVISTDQVVFPNDFGARMFISEDSKWVEVKNFMGYPPDATFLLSKTADPLHRRLIVYVSPILPDSSKATTVRIFLIANIYRNGNATDEKTAGYIDFNLAP